MAKTSQKAGMSIHEFVKKQTLAEESLGRAGRRRQWWRRTVSKRRAAEASLGGVEAARVGHGWLARGWWTDLGSLCVKAEFFLIAQK